MLLAVLDGAPVELCKGVIQSLAVDTGVGDEVQSAVVVNWRSPGHQTSASSGRQAGVDR